MHYATFAFYHLNSWEGAWERRQQSWLGGVLPKYARILYSTNERLLEFLEPRVGFF